MTKLNDSELGFAMVMAGFCPPILPDNYDAPYTKDDIISWLDVAVAVCLAESGGDPAAKNPSSSATGLWQIMYSVHKDKVEPAYKFLQETYNYKTDMGEGQDRLLDPVINSRVALMVYGESPVNPKSTSRFSPWEAYNTGAYKAYLGHGKTVYATAGKAIPIAGQFRTSALGNTVRDVKDSVGGVVSSVPNAIASATKSTLGFVKAGAINAGVFILGLIVVILGVWFLLNKPVPIPAASTIKKVAKNAG